MKLGIFSYHDKSNKTRDIMQKAIFLQLCPFSPFYVEWFKIYQNYQHEACNICLSWQDAVSCKVDYSEGFISGVIPLCNLEFLSH